MTGFRRQGNLFVPNSPAEGLVLFQDSSKLPYNSGRLVTSLVFPERYVEERLNVIGRECLSRLGQDAREFKGSRLTNGNADVYRAFLSTIYDGVEIVSSVNSIYSVVNVLGRNIFSDQALVGSQSIVEDIWSENTTVIPEPLLHELTHQVLLLGTNKDAIFGARYRTRLSVVCDNEGSLTEVSELPRAFLGSGMAVFDTTNRLFPRTLNAMRSGIPGWNVLPKVTSWEYVDSRSSLGVQAADIVNNLFHGALRFGTGDTSSASELRDSILREVVPGFALPPDLIPHVHLDTLPDHQEDIVCDNPELVSHFTLEPSSRE